MRQDRQSLGAVVMSVFSPDAGLRERVTDLAALYPRIILVDDGSPGNSSALHSKLREILGVTVVELESNVGTAGALNAGIELARHTWNLTWVLTLDQDSTFGNGYVEEGLRAWSAAEGQGLVIGAIGPGNTGMVLKDSGFDGMVYERTNFTLQSGTIFPTATFDAIGLLDETLVIDGLDTEFSLRMRKAGRDIIAAPKMALVHQIGDSGIKQIKFFGRTVTTQGRPRLYLWRQPFRNYYSARNSIVIGRRHGENLFWKFWYMKFLFLQVFLGPDHVLQARAVSAGIADGLRGRSGKIPDRVIERIQRRLIDEQGDSWSS